MVLSIISFSDYRNICIVYSAEIDRDKVTYTMRLKQKEWKTLNTLWYWKCLMLLQRNESKKELEFFESVDPSMRYNIAKPALSPMQDRKHSDATKAQMSQAKMGNNNAASRRIKVQVKNILNGIYNTLNDSAAEPIKITERIT